jgi:hypothetical protein
MARIMVMVHGHGSGDVARQAAELASQQIRNWAAGSSLLADAIEQFYVAAPADRDNHRQQIARFVQNRFWELHEALFFERRQDLLQLSDLGASAAIAIVLEPVNGEPEAIVTKAGRGSIYRLNETLNRFDPLTPDFGQGMSYEANKEGKDLLRQIHPPEDLIRLAEVSRGRNRPLIFWLGGSSFSNREQLSNLVLFQASVPLVRGDKLVLLSDRIQTAWNHSDLRDILFHGPQESEAQANRLLPLVRGEEAQPPYVSQTLGVPMDSIGEAGRTRRTIPAALIAEINVPRTFEAAQLSPPVFIPLTAMPASASRSVRPVETPPAEIPVTEDVEPVVPPEDWLPTVEEPAATRLPVRAPLSLGLPSEGLATTDIGGFRYGLVPPGGYAVPVAQIPGEGLIVRLGAEPGQLQLLRVSAEGQAWRVNVYNPVLDIGTGQPVISEENGLPEFNTSEPRFTWLNTELVPRWGRNSATNFRYPDTEAYNFISNWHAVSHVDTADPNEPLLALWDGDGNTKISANGTWVLLGRAPDPPQAGQEEKAGLEEPRRISVEEFVEGLTPAQMQKIPSGANTVWVRPIPSVVTLYSQSGLSAGLEQKFQRELPEDLRTLIRVVQLPLQPAESYQKPGVIFKDAGMNVPVENPLGLPMLEIWLADVQRVNPAAVILLALRGYEDAGVKLLGVMTYQDAQGQTMLAVFA